MVADGFPMSDSSDDSADTVISVLDSRLLSQALTDSDSPLESSDSDENPESDEMGNRQGSEKKKKKDDVPQEKKVEEKSKKKGKKSKGKSKRSSQNIESDFASTEGACASPSSTERPRSKSRRPDVLADLGQHAPGSPLGSPGSTCGSQGTWSPDDESDVSTLGYSTPLLSTPQVQRYVLPKQPQQSSTERLDELGRSIERTILDKLSDKPPGEGAAAGAGSGAALPGPERKGRRNVKKKRALGQAVIDSDSFTLPLEDVKGGQTSSPSPTSKRLNVGTDKISLRASQESPVSPWLRDDDTPVDEEQMDEMFISCIDLSYNLADICSEKEFTEYGSLDSKKQSRSPRERSKDTSLSPRIARKPIVPMTAPLVPILPELKLDDSRETPPKSDSSTSTLAEIGRDPVSEAVDLDVTESAAACDASPPVAATNVSKEAAPIVSQEAAPIVSQEAAPIVSQDASQSTEPADNIVTASKGVEKQQQAKKKQGKSKSKSKSKKRNSKGYDAAKENDIPVETIKTEEVSTTCAKSDSIVCDNTRLEVCDDVKEPVSDYDNEPTSTVEQKEYNPELDPFIVASKYSNSDTSGNISALTIIDSDETKCDNEIAQENKEHLTSESNTILDSISVDTGLDSDSTLTSEAAIDGIHIHKSTDASEPDITTPTAKADDTSSQTCNANVGDISSKPKMNEEAGASGSVSKPDVTEKAEETSTSKPNETEKADEISTSIKTVVAKEEATSITKTEVTGKDSSSNLSPNEPASPKHVPPPSPSAMDALAEIDEDDEEAIEAMEDNSQLKEVQLFGETVFKRLSSLVESQSQDEDLEERFKDFHESDDVVTDSPPVDLGSMALLSDNLENEERCTESNSAKEVVEELVVPGSVMSVEKSVTNIADSTDVLQLSNNDGMLEKGQMDDKEDVDDGTLKRKKKKSSQKKNKKDKSKKGNVVKKPEIPAELKQAERNITHSDNRRESKTEDESEKENTPPKRESQQIEEVIDAYGIVDNVEKLSTQNLIVDDGRPRYVSDGSDDDDSDSSFNTKSRSSELPSSSSIELTPRGIPEIEETFSELLSVKHILEDLEDRTPTEEVLPSFAGYDELRSPPELVNGRRSRMSPAVTDRTESDLDISEQRDDISTDSMYADDEDDGTTEVLFSRSYSEPAGNEVVVSCTFYNTQHNNNTNIDDSDDFWEDYSTADESFKQIEISADAASSTFQNARKQMHDIHQHLQDLRRQMEHLQEEVESATLTPEYSMDSEDKRPITE